MKEKIQLLSKGIFAYENPVIDVSDHDIVIDAASGENYTGFFEISSRNDVEIRAMIFSSNKWMRLRETSFVGKKGRIHYTFDIQALETGERSEGTFAIVSNGGEIEIPYRVRVHAPYCETSMGPMNELEQFAALARADWNEALHLFASDQFRKVFLNHKKNRNIYDTLIDSRDQGLAMEEFLCAVKRKKPVKIQVSQDLIEFEDLDKEASGMLLIEKNNWGHVNLRVRTEGSFISVFKTRITDADFLGSYYQLEYRVRPERVNVAQGKIILETFNQCVEVPVCCSRLRDRSNQDYQRRSDRSFWYELNRLFMKQQMGKISREEWISLSRDATDGCQNISREPIYKIAEAHYLNLAGQEKTASELLESINGRELRYKSAILYSYYLFVSALVRKDEQYTQFVSDTIRFYAEGQYREHWELTYFLLTLAGRNINAPMRTLRQIRESYDMSLIGPTLYLAAVKLINENPTILHEMGDFETSLFLWGCRHDLWGREAIYQFTELIGKMRCYHGGTLRALMHLCHIYESKDLLTAVLHLLILGKRKEPEMNHWYLLGIESSIRMPDLYEYYMATLDLKARQELPTAVLIYFQYDNSLGTKQKAYLFRYILEHRSRYEKIFGAYDNIIKTFTLSQLQKGQIDDDMAELYKYYLTKDVLTSHNLRALPKVIFKQKVVLEAAITRITHVIVDYAEVEKEFSYPVEDLEACVDIFMDDYRILFADEEGGRYMSSVPYRMEKLIDAGRYIRECYDQCRDNEMVVLNRSERALKYQMMDDASVEVYKRVLKLEGVNRHYQKTILKNLIDYYYDSYEGETLEKYLLQLDIRLLGHAERSHIIEYFIQRGLYTKAYQAIMTYGYEGIQDKRIMRLSSRIIRENKYEQDALLTELAYHAFSGGKYDEAVLKYLVLHYNGSTGQLYQIWRAAKDFEVPARALEERLISEILFTENHLAEGCEVFGSYYDDFQSGLLIRAFLAYYAYAFLMDRQEAKQKIFRVMEIELDQLEQMRDLCALALLKYYGSSVRSESEYEGWIQKEVSGFVDKGILLPFFRRFAGIPGISKELVDLSYVSCHADPDDDVMIHYTMENKKEEKSEPMKHVYGDIFVKTFRLFSGDQVSYTITGTHTDAILGEGTISASVNREGRLTNGIDKINRMLDYLDFHDDQALDDALVKYDRLDMMTDKLFDLK